MIIAIPRETVPGERRVALVAESVKRLVGKKHEVVVESGAGLGAECSDEELRAAGARIESSASAVYSAADLVLKVQPPGPEELPLLKPGSVLVSLAYPMANPKLARELAQRQVTLLALDMVPRTTLAQMMDVLSSQATIAGYRAVLLAAEALPKLFPMLMTAAGTIPPAKVLVLGAGVAGLQAIATARRLGAVVEAYDVRKVVKEQVESLGARFVNIEIEDAAGSGGYAKELSEEAKKKQAEALAVHVAKSDAVITTAQIPGRRAPVLLPADMVRRMKSGSVVVDIAAEQGGNCELSRPGERYRTDNGVTLIGERNLPSQLAVHASAMFSRNLEKLLAHVTDKDGALKLDTADEIVKGMLITRGGDIIHPAVADVALKEAS
ncbi:Re/Si-specific NAD(P)(+) transhydrogenase subunit alpha [Myxococcus sp. RHSTA-1-4]|uniref:Re/Si-specific NAD(P)(+) transhydrogenase subunit alpha n=1 Tax=Myxococcus sp. RHSTA-1-4 TaxID=2874601 RepID=UPI001CBAD50C|nr:Re/Si-specific NAD(P)(+) transhydrogenase subunit alpha [Myxococcus sp. RHSTA-1-4]MBZ4415647.1 Re/Si-specific NAD(P)(+) transhydrogenase subunit alpha [Myxococcus sp. RHSTA-1-4]